MEKPTPSGARLLTGTFMSIERLAQTFVKRLRANNLQGFEDLLTNPLAAQALDYNEGLVFRLACGHNNIGFLRATLPYTLPRYIGKELPDCIGDRNIELFTTLVHSHPSIFNHLPDGLLNYLAVVGCVGTRKDPEPPYVVREMLTVLLNAAPEQVVCQQIQQMHKYKASVDALAWVNEAVAEQQRQRQKNLLAQEIEEHGRGGRARKI